MRPLPADLPERPAWTAVAALAGAYVAATAATLAVALVLAFAGVDDVTPAGVLLMALGGAAAAVGAVLLLARTTEAPRPEHLGLQMPSARLGLAGLAVGAAGAALLGLLATGLGDPFGFPSVPRELSEQARSARLAGDLDLTAVDPGAAAAASFAARAVVAVIAGELVLRGFVLPVLADRLGLPGAMAVAALLSGALGAANGAGAELLLPAVVLGLLLSWLYVETGSILPGTAVASGATGAVLAAGLDWSPVACAVTAGLCAVATLALLLPAALGRRTARTVSQTFLARSEAGQTSAEYVGGLLVVSVVIAALALTTAGADIRRGIECTIRGIVGQPCTPAEQAGIDPECLTGSDTREANFSVNVVAVKIGEGMLLIEERYADGRTVFTLVEDVEVAAELLAGVKAHAGRIGFNASASLSAGGRLEGARVFEFSGEQQEEADAFRDLVRNEGTFSAFLHDAFEGAGGGPLGFLDPFGIKDAIADSIFGEDADDLPEPTSSYVDVEAFLEGEGTLAAGVPGLDAELEGVAEAAGGVKVITSGKDAGTAELHFELSADASAGFGVLALGPNIGGDATFTATMTLAEREDGTYGPTKLRLVGTAGYTGAPLELDHLADSADELGDLSTFLEEASIRSTDGSGRQIEFAADLDLDDPRNLAAVLGVLDPTGTVGPTAATELARRLDEDGRLTLQHYDTESSEFDAEIKGGAGLNAGVGGGQSSDGQALTDAMVREPGGVFEPRGCGLS